MSTINFSPETKSLSDLFTSIKDVEIIPWQNSSEAVGLSLLKDYSKTGGFIPVKNPKGESDSVAMIRVWYLIRDSHEQKETKKIKLYVAIIKSSRYLFKHHFYFVDKDSPTKDSLEESKCSKQPVDLEVTSRYELHINEKKIYDLEKKDYISPKELVEHIYKLHITTGKKISFQIKVFLQKIIVESIPIISNFLKKNKFIFFW